MPAGRPPKPTSVLKSGGGFRKDRHGHREHTPESGTTIEKPSWLAGDASDFWDRNLPKLETMGILDGIDESQLAGLATAWANWRKEQSDYESGTGHIYKVANAWNMFDKIGSKFGFSPTERAKLAIEPPSDELDPFEEWLKQKNHNEAEWAKNQAAKAGA